MGWDHIVGCSDQRNQTSPKVWVPAADMAEMKKENKYKKSYLIFFLYDIG